MNTTRLFCKKKIYKYGENTFKVTEESESIVVSNGVEEVQMNKLAQYQKEGVLKFRELVNGTTHEG